jgi:hypothetical protein
VTVSLSIVEPGTIGDYSDLVSLVSNWLDRSDLDPRIPEFVALLEARLNRLLRTLNMEITLLQVANSETMPLPSDFRMLRFAYLEGSPDRPLRQISPSATPTLYAGESGTPVAFSISGRNMTLIPPPAGDVTVSLTYFRRIPALTASVPQNWLLTEHADIYVWGTLNQAAIYIRDPDAINFTKALMDEAIAELQTASARDKWGSGQIAPSGPRQVRGGRC